MPQSNPFPSLTLPPDTIMGLPIHTDWRVWASLRDVEVTNDTKRRKYLCRLVFVREEPSDIRMAEHQIMYWWFNAFDMMKGANSGGEGVSRRKSAFDFIHDFSTIYADFYREYRIDLYSPLHWYKFVRLFAGLSSESAMARIMNIRTRNINDIENPKERTQYIELQSIHALPKTAEELEEDRIEQNLYDSLTARIKHG